MKQETLEEAAKEFVLSHDFSKLTNPNHLANRCFQFGANWQAERMYSEDDVDELVNNLIDKFLNYNGSSIDSEKLKLFYQQIKKK